MTASQMASIAGLILLAPHIKEQHAKWISYGLLVFAAVSMLSEQAGASC